MSTLTLETPSPQVAIARLTVMNGLHGGSK